MSSDGNGYANKYHLYDIFIEQCGVQWNGTIKVTHGSGQKLP